nr:PRC-barrel domain containing protein [Actinomycetales bacterium]
MIGLQDFDRILDNNTDVVDPHGDKIGTVGRLYVNDATDEPSFVTVRTGLFGNRETFVPLDDARIQGEHLVVPFGKDQVKDAPQVESDGGITPEDEESIYNFYGVEGVGGMNPGHQSGERSSNLNDAGTHASWDTGRTSASSDTASDTGEDGRNPGAATHPGGGVGTTPGGGMGTAAGSDTGIGTTEAPEAMTGEEPPVDPGPSRERETGREGGEQLGDHDVGREGARRERDHEIAEELFAGKRQQARLRLYERPIQDGTIADPPKI